MNHTLKDINWRSISSILLFIKLLKELGCPDLIDKNIGGNAIWEKWKTKCKIIIYDKSEYLLSSTFPICPFAGYKNIIISSQAMDYMIQKINKMCYPVVIMNNCRVRLRAKTWNTLLQNIIMSMKITVGEYTENSVKNTKEVKKAEKIIENYFHEYSSEILNNS
jgi:hypothetical protein